MQESMTWIYSMKEKLVHIILFAIALLTACDQRALGPGVTDQDNAISLALSLKHIEDDSASQTKMSPAITQDGSGFRGIEQIYVIPFQTESAAPVNAGSARLGNRNVLIQDPSISQAGLIANNSSHLYNFVQIPISTNRVLAYGKAFNSGSVSTKEGKHKNGVLTPSGLDDPNTASDISFSLESILETDEMDTISQTVDNLIAALNAVVAVMQTSEDADIRSYLSTFSFDNLIIACSYRAIYQLEQYVFGALSEYSGTNPDAINALMTKLSALQAACSAAGSNFPASYGIPEGSVGMWWNGHRYVKIISGVNISLVPENLYRYPPSLWYYANSTVKTTEDSNVKGQYKSNNETWSEILLYYSGSSVSSTTRSVAIVDQMEYGVGLAEFRLIAQGEAAAAAGCPLTGIIIGDQHDVDYSFAPKTSNPESLFIYDNTISGVTLGGASQFQILVLPTSVNQTVHFALEFENTTGSAFPCRQGTVLPGCKFYLAGELKPTDGTKPDNKYTGGVFDSDHKTTVNVWVSSLDNVYNTVPDLRDPQLELGVVAEMDWGQLEPGGVKLPF